MQVRGVAENTCNIDAFIGKVEMRTHWRIGLFN